MVHQLLNGSFFMAKLTIEKARKILGQTAEKVTDQELERDIVVAETLKNLFFTQYINKRKFPNSYNENNHGKT